MRTVKILHIAIGGHVYNVLVNLASRKIVETECVGRWAMTCAATGDSWLDESLQTIVDERFRDMKQTDILRLLGWKYDWAYDGLCGAGKGWILPGQSDAYFGKTKTEAIILTCRMR